MATASAPSTPGSARCNCGSQNCGKAAISRRFSKPARVRRRRWSWSSKKPGSAACRPAVSTIWFKRWGCPGSASRKSPSYARRSTSACMPFSIGGWPYLWLDATYLKQREGGRIVSVAAIIAVAANRDGRREIVGLHIGPSEAETFWSTFLRSLARRGLRGVKLVISDAHEGLKAAIRRVFGAGWQRCRVHWMRNALAYVPKTQQSMVAAALRQAFLQPDRAQPSQMLRHVADQLRQKWPKLAAFIDDSETE